MTLTAVDLFAGCGGSTTGIEQAGLRVKWAGNHWPAAVEWHRRNHPHVCHACQDLHQANWYEVPGHDLLAASPSCQGHAFARGKDRPHHDAARSTAWAVVSCAEVHRPRAVVVENVPEFTRWILYPAWREAMRALGYDLAENVIDAADLGVPQHRRRLFLTARRKRPARPLALPQRAHVPAQGVIDWNAPGWRPWAPAARLAQGLRPLEPLTVARILDGRRELGPRFLLAYYGTGGPRSLARPIGTLTTRDRYGVVDGDRYRMINVDEQRAFMGFPDDYALPPQRKLATHMLGNAVCPVAMEEVVRALTVWL